jgi:hypothetical protein
MKRQTVAAIAVSAVLSLSLATQAGAADAKSTGQHPHGWLTQVVEWIAKKVQTVTAPEKQDAGNPAAGGTNLDRCGALDPWGGSCA